MSWGEGFETGAADRLVDVFGEVAAGLARACDLIVEADRGQEFLADGAPNMAQWLTARFGVEASFGRRLVKVAHRLQDLPTLRDRFASGGLSFDAVEVLSEFATSDTEAGLAAKTYQKISFGAASCDSNARPLVLECGHRQSSHRSPCSDSGRSFG